MTDPASVEAPAPAAVDGAAFEAPADDEAMVPAPAPNAAAPRSGGGSSADEEVMGLQDELSEGEGLLEHKSQVREPGLAPQGIVLQDAGRSPTVQELVHLQDQKNAATLSSRLGSNAARLTPADLMPEEVAKLTRTGGFSAGSLLPEDSAAFPAAVQHASLSTQPVEMAEPAQSAHKPASLNLPPATVGPLSLRLAAANGDPSAAFEVGARLAEGKGTDQNFKEAVTWYQRSASQGFAQAQYRLGTLYERGLGVKADAGRARMWYQRAAEQGNVKAMHNLAVLSAGRESGSPDYTTAAQWFTSAAEHGLADSQYNLAVLFENGLGVTKSSERAFVWYALAAKSGDKEAARRRDVLEAQLTVAARDEALRTVKIFQPKRINAIVNDPRVAGEDWKKREASAAYR
jgi:localization factor PodJL